MLLYKGSEFLNRLQRSYVVVSTLPVCYSEGEYPVRIEMELEDEDEGLEGSFSYDKNLTQMCQKCGESGKAFWMRIHQCEGTD